jgi:thymidylate synthase
MDYEASYDSLVKDVIGSGQARNTRNGATLALFGQSLFIGELEFGEFPLLTRRRIYYKGVLGELAAFVRGATVIRDFKEWGCNYWDRNAKAWVGNLGLMVEDMEVGQIYGAQWVNWEKSGHNQLKHVIASLKNDPDGRRHVLTTYSPTAQACLPPCHLLTQFYANNNGALDCQVYMRSVDLILGLPSDVVLYSALLIAMAAEVGRRPGTLQFVFGDTHVYVDHIDTYLERQARNQTSKLPTYALLLSGVLDFKPDNIEIQNYQFAEAIPYELNV